MEVMLIKNIIQSDRRVVIAFLEELKNILNSEDFDLAEDIIVIKKEKTEREFSNAYTLVELEYDYGDVVECLKGLTVAEYSETLFDNEYDDLRALYVFGKVISNRLIYIKIRIQKDDSTKRVLCLSFHFAKHDMNYPYSK